MEDKIFVFADYLNQLLAGKLNLDEESNKEDRNTGDMTFTVHYGEVLDPYGGSLDIYRRSRDQLAQMIDELIKAYLILNKTFNILEMISETINLGL